MESLLQGNEQLAAFVFFFICFIQPILLPLPEAATVSAGSAVLGSLPAASISFIGSLLGIIVAYFISKNGGQWLAQKFIKEKHLQQYKRYVSRNETSILLLLFVIPIIPDEIICFGAGLSGVSFKKFLLIAGISKLITSISIAYSVDFAKSLALTNAELTLLLILTVGLIMLTSYVSKKMLLKRNKVEKKMDA